jgi:hypothetical protein
LNLSKEFDRYIEKRNLKEKQPELEGKEDQVDERKKQNEKFIDEDE